MIPDIVLTDAPDPAAHRVLIEGIVQFNRTQTGAEAPRPLLVLLKHPDTGEVLGGLSARTGLEWLYIELLYIPNDLRGAGLGAELMRRAETEAAQRGCSGVWVDTYSFQARGFYEKLGYKVFGILEDYPPGQSRIFLQKRLAADLLR